MLAPASAAAQETAAAQLWRLAAATAPVPQALASGGVGTIWNPAQPPPGGRATVSLDIIQTPTAVDARGALFVSRVRIRPVGELGLVYGDMRLADLVRTSLSPMPDSGTIPYAARFVGANWTTTRRGTTLGATLGLDDGKLDVVHTDRAAFDVGVRQVLVSGVRVAAAAHLLSRLTGGDAAHDLYAGVEWRVWRGTPWRGSDPASLLLRTGLAAGHGVSADYHVGMGIEIGRQFVADFQLTREGGYSADTWRGSAGVQLKVGRYRVRYARDTGVSDFGSAYRVGLETEIR